MKRKLILILSVLLSIGAVAIIAYPMIANYINDRYQSTIRTEYAHEIQEWLGHSDISTTSNIYTHLDYSSKVASANAIPSLLDSTEAGQGTS